MAWGNRGVGGLLAVLVCLAIQVVAAAKPDSASLATDLERVAASAKRDNPDQELDVPVDKIYEMRDAMLTQSKNPDGADTAHFSPVGQHVDSQLQDPRRPSTVPASKQEQNALRRSSESLFKEDHGEPSAAKTVERSSQQVRGTNAAATLKQPEHAGEMVLHKEANQHQDAVMAHASTPKQHEKAVEASVVQEEANRHQAAVSTLQLHNSVEGQGGVILREDSKNTTVNETLEKQKEEERKRQEEAQKEKEKQKKEDEAKVRLGIEIASETDREARILRCIDGGPKIDAKDIRAPNVSAGIYMLNLEADDGLTSGQFFADFLLFLRQGDKPLKGKDPMANLAFTNARSIHGVKDYGSGVQRVSGTFFFSPDLRWFPFDKQTLEIVLEQFNVPVAAWQFVPDYHLNGLSPSIRFPGWQASLRYGDDEHANCRASAGFKVYPGASLDSMESAANVSFSRFSYQLMVQRPIIQGFMTHFIPPMIMLTPTVFSYTLDPLQHIAMRFSIAGGALISIILFHTSVEGSLPPIEYMCLFDKFIFCVYFAVFCALATSVLVAILFRDASADADSHPATLRAKLHNISLRCMVLSTMLIFGGMFPIWCLLGTESSWVVLILCTVYLVFLYLQWNKVRRDQYSDAASPEDYQALGERQP